MILEDDARLIGSSADVAYALRHCHATGCHLAYLGASFDMLLSHAYYLTPAAASVLLRTSKPMCNVHKQDWVIRDACVKGLLKCVRPTRGLTLGRKQDWHGLLGWGLVIQDHASTPSFTVGYAKYQHGTMNATKARLWNEHTRCALPLD